MQRNRVAAFYALESSTRKKSMRFGIGDIVHHQATKEQGRIVRVCKVRERAGYVVAMTGWSGNEIEALWFPRDIRELVERARTFRPSGTSKPR